MVYMHAVVAAFRIYAQRGEDAAKTRGWKMAFNSHGNYIVDHGKSWKNHGIVFLNSCGNPDSSSWHQFTATAVLLRSHTVYCCTGTTN